MFRKRNKEILAKYIGQNILLKDIGANFFGQESLGFKQIRGNGVLILTKSELFYGMWFPKKEINIPLKEITKIENPKWHLQKTKNRPLLKIFFINNLSKEDSVAWLVRDCETWTNLLSNIIIKRSKF